MLNDATSTLCGLTHIWYINDATSTHCGLTHIWYINDATSTHCGLTHIWFINDATSTFCGLTHIWQSYDIKFQWGCHTASKTQITIHYQWEHVSEYTPKHTNLKANYNKASLHSWCNCSILGCYFTSFNKIINDLQNQTIIMNAYNLTPRCQLT